MVGINLTNRYIKFSDTYISRDETEESEEQLERERADISDRELDAIEHEYTDNTVILEIRFVRWNLTK